MCIHAQFTLNNFLDYSKWMRFETISSSDLLFSLLVQLSEQNCKKLLERSKT